jgi:hypothetical protein
MMTNKYEILQGNITRNQRLSAHKIYVICAEVRVRKNVRLTIEDGTTLLIQNGKLPKAHLLRAALIFDQGSILRAQRFTVKACDSDFRPVRTADNGGIWFLGNYQTASKDKLSVKVNRKNPLSSFKAEMISSHYLGRRDPLKETTRTKVVDDDIDGFSVLGVGPDEWQISEVRSFYSGDDGFDVTNSHIKLDRLRVLTPTEDGINLSSSRLEIRRSLTVDVSKTDYTDRDVFDFETDNGACYLEIAQHCHVDLKGIFGDEVVLSSQDLPKIPKNLERSYRFKGVSRKAASLIYSINLD